MNDVHRESPPPGFYRCNGDILWLPVRRQYYAMNVNASVSQLNFAFGDPGTESGHSIDTIDTDRTVQLAGMGDYNFFLRFELEQPVANADTDLTWAFRLQVQVNTGGYGTCPATAGSNKVYISNHASITQGDDTTDRVSGSVRTFVSNNNGVCDTSADTASMTWDPATNNQEHIEVLYSLTVQDAQAVANDVFDFRMVRNDDSLLTYTIANATLTWQAGSMYEDNIDVLSQLVFPEKRERITVFS